MCLEEADSEICPLVDLEFCGSEHSGSINEVSVYFIEQLQNAINFSKAEL